MGSSTFEFSDYVVLWLDKVLPRLRQEHWALTYCYSNYNALSMQTVLCLTFSKWRTHFVAITSLVVDEFLPESTETVFLQILICGITITHTKTKTITWQGTETTFLLICIHAWHNYHSYKDIILVSGGKCTLHRDKNDCSDYHCTM